MHLSFPSWAHKFSLQERVCRFLRFLLLLRDEKDAFLPKLRIYYRSPLGSYALKLSIERDGNKGQQPLFEYRQALCLICCDAKLAVPKKCTPSFTAQFTNRNKELFIRVCMLRRKCEKARVNSLIKNLASFSLLFYLESGSYRHIVRKERDLSVCQIWMPFSSFQRFFPVFESDQERMWISVAFLKKICQTKICLIDFSDSISALEICFYCCFGPLELHTM